MKIGGEFVSQSNGSRISETGAAPKVNPLLGEFEALVGQVRSEQDTQGPDGNVLFSASPLSLLGLDSIFGSSDSSLQTALVAGAVVVGGTVLYKLIKSRLTVEDVVPQKHSIQVAESEDPFWLKNEERSAARPTDAEVPNNLPSFTDFLEPQLRNLLSRYQSGELQGNKKGIWLVVEGPNAKINIAVQNFHRGAGDDLNVYVSIRKKDSSPSFASYRTIYSKIHEVLDQHNIKHDAWGWTTNLTVGLDDSKGTIGIQTSGFGDLYMNIKVDPSQHDFPFQEIVQALIDANSKTLGLNKSAPNAN